jgi:hypothetical protein
MHLQKTKIGPAHGVAHRKVWIEGRHLKEAGFSPGNRYDRRVNPQGSMVIELTPDNTGKYKVAGKGEKPILDISGAIIPKLFPPPTTHVAVMISPSKIVISPAAL